VSDEAMTRTGGTAIVEALEAHGVEVVFGIPGTHNLELYRGLARSTAITHVTPRHEQGAGYAADGYARATGRPGVCVTTSGPGLANICAAAATAQADSVPLLIVAPGVPRGMEGRDVGLLHEVNDQRGMMGAILDVAVRAGSAEEAVAAIGATFAGWRAGRRRPVYVEVPVDVLAEPWAGEVGVALPVVAVPSPEPGALERAIAALGGARRPAVLLGAGARGAEAVARTVVEHLGAPTVTTVNAKGMLPESHPLSVGASLRLEPARRLLEEADIVLVVGSRVGDAESWDVTPALAGTVIRIDLDARAEHKNVRSDVFLHGAAEAVLGALARGLAGAGAAGSDGDGPARAAAAHAASLATALQDGGPWRAVNDALRAALPADTIVAGDSAQVSYYGTAHLWPMERPGSFLYPPNFATLGYGLPAAIGAQIGCPGRPVLVLVGDGGFLFSAAELMTAVERRLPIPIVVMNNHGYAEIRDGMAGLGFPPLAVDLETPDFAALSVACGGHGVRVEDVSQVGTLAAEALTRDRPTVVEVDLGPSTTR
jgi:thiamine pyrophosphate-dependent acetolactate synthase large subunit-like protein